MMIPGFPEMREKPPQEISHVVESTQEKRNEKRIIPIPKSTTFHPFDTCPVLNFITSKAL